MEVEVEESRTRSEPIVVLLPRVNDDYTSWYSISFLF